MSHVPTERLEPERMPRESSKRIALKGRQSPTADLALRQVVINAKRAGTLGEGSRWRYLDPTDDDAWSRRR
jgi:hypothetical protein